MAGHSVAGTEDRITRYMQTASGARQLALTVNGIRVLIQPRDDGEQAAAEALALAIAALGSAAVPAIPRPPTVVRAAPVEPVAPRPFAVGERVFCRVHGAQGWSTITDVGIGHNRGRIKIAGERAWCPVGNFTRKES